jgi:flagellar biosynthesis component FlhA
MFSAYQFYIDYGLWIGIPLLIVLIIVYFVVRGRGSSEE